MTDQDAGGPEAPIEGVSLERFAEVAVALHGATPEEVETRAQEQGIPPGRFTAISEAWNRRFAEHPELVRRYSDLYQQAMREAGIRAPDISLEQYAEILRSQASGDRFLEVLERFGLNLQTFALVSQGWIDKISADPSLAMRLATLMQHPHPPADQPPTLHPLL
ncbi:MAG: hypothetical protein ACRDJP_09730 [Actinomycetota bacterium]